MYASCNWVDFFRSVQFSSCAVIKPYRTPYFNRLAVNAHMLTLISFWNHISCSAARNSKEGVMDVEDGELWEKDVRNEVKFKKEWCKHLFRIVCQNRRSRRKAGQTRRYARTHRMTDASTIQCLRGPSSSMAEEAWKVAQTRLPSVGFQSWSRFLAVSLQVTRNINPAVGCHYFPPGLQLPSQPLRGLLPISLLGEQRHNICLRLLPDSVAAAIWTEALRLRLSQAR